MIELRKILESITARRFEPDTTRAGRFKVPNNLVKEIGMDISPTPEAPSAPDPPGHLSPSASSSGTSPASDEAMTEKELADTVHAGWKRAAAVGLSDNEILAWGRAVDEGRVVQHSKWLTLVCSRTFSLDFKRAELSAGWARCRICTRRFLAAELAGNYVGCESPRARSVRCIA